MWFVVLLVGADAADLRLVGDVGAARGGSSRCGWGGSGVGSLMQGRGAGWVCDWGVVLVWQVVRAAVGAVDGG